MIPNKGLVWEKARENYSGTKEEYEEDCKILDCIFSKSTELENMMRHDLEAQYMYDLHLLLSQSSYGNLRRLITSTNQLSDFISGLVKKYVPESAQIFDERQKRNLVLVEKMSRALCNTSSEGHA